MLTLLALGPGLVHTQERAPTRTIIIGELAGRTDYRDFTVLTENGLVSVSDPDVSKPFRVLSSSPGQVAIQFTRLLPKENPQGLIYRFYDNEQALVSALILNEADVAILEHEASALEVSRSNRSFLAVPTSMPENTVKLIFHNTRRPPLDSPEIRRAWSYGINHGQIIRRILDNKADLARGPFDTGSDLHNASMESYRYSPRKAIDILSDEGWRDDDGNKVVEKNGQAFEVELLFQRGLKIDEAIARAIKIDLFNIGINVKPRPVTKVELNDRMRSGNFDAILTDYAFKNSVESLRAVFSEDGPLNFTGYRSPTFEKYLGFYDNIPEDGPRKTLVGSLQSVINKDQPATFLYFKWLTHYMIDVQHFDNYRDEIGDIRPFSEWQIK